jgi:SAM-dependent methyltransferase
VIEHDNLEEYQDGAAYDTEYGSYAPAGPFYESLAARVGGPVLDLGCGTGRIAIPLAERGYAVTGLDMAPAMLAAARRKSAARGLHIRWVEGNACDFQLAERFRLIFMTGHAFQAFLDRPAQEALLARVREHLHPEGLWAFETRNPNPANLFADQTEAHWHDYIDPQGRTVSVSGYQTYDPIAQVQHYVTHRRTGDQVRTTRIALRYTFPQEMEALLHWSGFAVVERFGNFDRSPLTGESPEMIYVCRRRD